MSEDITKEFMINVFRGIGNLVVTSHMTDDEASDVLYITEGMIDVLNGKAVVKKGGIKNVCSHKSQSQSI